MIDKTEQGTCTEHGALQRGRKRPCALRRAGGLLRRMLRAARFVRRPLCPVFLALLACMSLWYAVMPEALHDPYTELDRETVTLEGRIVRKELRRGADDAPDAVWYLVPDGAKDVRVQVYPDGSGAKDVHVQVYPDGSGAKDVHVQVYRDGTGANTGVTAGDTVLTGGGAAELAEGREGLHDGTPTDAGPAIGMRVRVRGTVRCFRPATNPGEFDSLLYYRQCGVAFRLTDAALLHADGSPDPYREGLFRLQCYLADVIDRCCTEGYGAVIPRSVREGEEETRKTDPVRESEAETRKTDPERESEADARKAEREGEEETRKTEREGEEETRKAEREGEEETRKTDPERESKAKTRKTDPVRESEAETRKTEPEREGEAETRKTDPVRESEADAGMLKAVLLGDRSSMDRDLKKRYQEASLGHLYATSGLHCAAIGMALYALLKRLRVPPVPASLLCTALMVSYGVMCGMPVSAVRAVFMFSLRLLSPLAGRTYDALSACSLIGIMMLAEQPLYVRSAGFLLSFGAIAGLGLVLPALEALWRDTAQAVRQTFLRPRNHDMPARLNADQLHCHPSPTDALRLLLPPCMTTAILRNHCRHFMAGAIAAGQYGALRIKQKAEKKWPGALRIKKKAEKRWPGALRIKQKAEKRWPGALRIKQKAEKNGHGAVARGCERVRAALFACLAVALATLPVYMCFFYTFPVYSVFLNMLAIPLMGLLMPFGLAMLFAGSVSVPLGRLLLLPCSLSLRLIEALCGAGRVLPGHTWYAGHATALQVVLYYAMLAGFCLYAGQAGGGRAGGAGQAGGERAGSAVRTGVGRGGSAGQAGGGRAGGAVRTGGERNGGAVRTGGERAGGAGNAQACRPGRKQAWGGRPGHSGVNRTGRGDIVRRILPVLALVVISIRIPPPLQITFLDVGQGDGIVIRSGRHAYLIDGGSTSKTSVGEYQLIPDLKYEGIGYLDGVFVSHEDEDHINGILSLFDDMARGGIRIGHLFLPDIGRTREIACCPEVANVTAVPGVVTHKMGGAGNGIPDPGRFDKNRDRYLELALYAHRLGVPVTYLSAGQQVLQGRLVFTCLAPLSSGGNTSSGNPSGGNTSGGNPSGGNLAGGNPSGGSTASRSAVAGAEKAPQDIREAMQSAPQKIRGAMQSAPCVIHDLSSWSANEHSMVLHLQYVPPGGQAVSAGRRTFSALFTGDVEGAGLDSLNETLALLPESVRRVDLLKVAHHGSRHTTNNTFLSLTDARCAVISCGKNNRYGHPHAELLSRLEADGVSQIFTTADCGAITVTVSRDGSSFRLNRFLQPRNRPAE